MSTPVPQGWFVYEAGQSMTHMLWFMNLLSFEDIAAQSPTIRRVFVEEYDSFEEALAAAVKRVEAKDWETLEAT